MHDAILVPFGIGRVSIKFYKRTTCFEIMFKNLTASFFETGTMATPTKSQNPTVLGQGVAM